MNFPSLTLVLSIGLWASIVFAQAPMQLPLEVIINGHNEGTHFLELTENNDILITPETLKSFRIKDSLWKGQKQKVISLQSLAPKLQFSIDSNSGIVNIALEPALFEPQTIEKKNELRPCVQNKKLSPKHRWQGLSTIN